MSWRVVMIEKGEYLRLKLDNLFVKKGKEEYTIPLSDISVILIENLDAVLTTRLLDSCASNDIVVVTCDYKHQPVGVYTGLNTHSRASKIIKQQILWDDSFKEKTWQSIVKAKIENQMNLLKRLNINNESIELLEQYTFQIEGDDLTNREGHAAKVYFNCLFGLKFTRNDDDFINVCLDYIYSVLRAFFTRLLVCYGYSGMIGVHHKSEYNNFNLADDLMEPFRPYCDYYVIQLLQKEKELVFDLDTRMYLVDFLNSKIKYNNQNSLMINVIEKYMHSFIRYCKVGRVEEFILPDISQLE